MLEVHYNNPTLRKAIDSSGIRLHLTPVLRPNEAGIFVSGVAVSPLHLIPPRQMEYATAGYCNPDCTDKVNIYLNIIFPIIIITKLIMPFRRLRHQAVKVHCASFFN